MQLLKQEEVAVLLKMSVETFRKSVKHYSKFPKPKKLTPKSRPRWELEDIENYIKSL